MWIKFLRPAPLLDTPEYRDLMANRMPAPHPHDGMRDLAVLWVLQQASSLVQQDLLGYRLGDLMKRAGLTEECCRESIWSLSTRGFLEVLEGGKNSEPQDLTELDVLNCWNQRVRECGRIAGAPRLIRASMMTKGRRQKIRTRLSEPEWWGAFRHALRMLPLKPPTGFCWQPDLDWLIKNGTNAFRIAEGQFNAR